MNWFLIDGFNQAFRSHFAFLQLTTKAGIPSGCVYGFLTALRSLKKKYPNFHFVVAWDSEARRKKAAYPEYKANRPRFQIDEPIRDLKSILACLNVDQVQLGGEEADDVIASFIARHPEDKIYIYSNDKDLLQLVRDGKVVVIRPRSGKDNKAYDEEAVKVEFGVDPRDLASYLSFRGDSVDNLPGVPRVPSKVIASLVQKYKTPRGVYASIPEEKLTDFQRQSFIGAESQVLLNFDLVQLNKDLDFESKKGSSNQEIFSEVLGKYEIKSISADAYVSLFEGEGSFLVRESPQVESLSLFDV